MTDTDILTKLKEIALKRIPELNKEVFSMDTVLKRDLGLDSMNFITLIIDIEQEFNINIPEGVWIQIITVGDAVNIISSLLGSN